MERRIWDILERAERVAVLTGAGVSAASGIPTFREAQTGLWARFSPEALASPDAYAKNPELVWQWYAWRIELCRKAVPNAAHTALAKLEERKAPGFTLVTQNVDGLHARAGSHQILELHGNLALARCERCAQLQPLEENFVPPPICETCGSRMRPNVVWFGESLPHETLESSWHAFARCDLALVIGTSGVVTPASSLAAVAKRGGAWVIEINPTETPLSSLADEVLRGDAAEILPALLNDYFLRNRAAFVSDG